MAAAERHGCHGGDGATLPAAIEADLKARVGQVGMRIDAIESTAQPKPQPQYAQVAPGVVFLGCARLGAAGASDEDILNYAQRTMIPLGTQSLLNALKKAGIKAQANGDEGWVVTVNRASTVMTDTIDALQAQRIIDQLDAQRAKFEARSNGRREIDGCIRDCVRDCGSFSSSNQHRGSPLSRNTQKDLDLATEIWAAAQTTPGEGIEDAENRIAQILADNRQAKPIPDEVLVLMNHIEDVLPDDAWDLIDRKTWNAVTALAAAR